MTMEINLIKRYNFLLDTLILACPSLERLTDDEIEEYLEELEGDYYTFFDYNNLYELYNAGILSYLQVEKIELLKKKISNIPTNLWNKNALQMEPQWKEVRVLSNEILNSLGVSKRKIDPG